MTIELALSVGSLVTMLIAFLVGVLKARDWVETVALAALKGGEGRSVVVDAVADRHSRVEDKLDTLTQSLSGMADRLEGRIENLSARMEARLDRLDKEQHQIDVRLSVIESTK